MAKHPYSNPGREQHKVTFVPPPALPKNAPKVTKGE
jgi:hypothetical protein